MTRKKQNAEVEKQREIIRILPVYKTLSKEKKKDILNKLQEWINQEIGV